MRTSTLILALALGMISCAGQSNSKAHEAAPAAPAPQRLAWQYYLRITRGELVPLAQIEGSLGAGKLVSPSRTDRQWSFADSDDFLVASFDSESRATNAYWGLSYGGRTKVTESKSERLSPTPP
jgi:hypothetical protein